MDGLGPRNAVRPASSDAGLLIRQNGGAHRVRGLGPLPLLLFFKDGGMRRTLLRGEGRRISNLIFRIAFTYSSGSASGVRS